jgi:hypothetical protein
MMASAKTALPLILGFIGLCALLPAAQADDFGFYAVGSFQFDSTTISGNAGGICSGQCVPWGDLAVLNVFFSASVNNYQETASCSNGQCKTEISGEFGDGSVSAYLAVGDPPQVYYLSSGFLAGSFDSHFCTGNCRSYRPETELSLDFAGTWNNGWYSDGTIDMECFQNGGCSAGSGAGDLNTVTPEPSSVALLGSSIPWLASAIRRKRL